MRDAFSRSGSKRWFAPRSTHALAILAGAALAHVSLLALAAGVLLLFLWRKPSRAVVAAAEPIARRPIGERFRECPTRENAFALRRALREAFSDATIPAGMRAIAAELEQAVFVRDDAFPAAADRVLASMGAPPY